ncbi:hypothetical protein K443DRAFT_624070 [Laccaria amethystina LaAM-08-1]|uniref:Uncharacterized protein n=1 Tax=Laccaria amethystina LaAM-08-1 TaxID=1095629 RepID=A0A0C9WP15_9AGAR|nr:hypothetical protein K443DRAFT_624070 [Laccaria amethystina LaAM-08-1]
MTFSPGVVALFKAETDNLFDLRASEYSNSTLLFAALGLLENIEEDLGPFGHEQID